MISAIVAVDNDWGIGFNGELLERIPEDLKYFKSMVEGKVLIMGRKTWDSLPQRIFSQRDCIIISSQCKNIITIPNTRSAYMSFDRALRALQNETFRSLDEKDLDIMIIGGGQIYKQLLPLCKKVYVTKIYKKHENIDTFFPNLDETDEWKATPISDVREYNDISYQFWIYERV